MITILLLIIAIGLGYLVFVQYRQSNSSDKLDSSNRVLVIELREDLAEADISDEKQVRNALKNGGMIRLNISDLGSSLKSKIEPYAASNSDNRYWILGAFLNYISSEGWELTQAPTTGLSQLYYFKKR